MQGDIPSLSVTFSVGNLLENIDAPDGIAALCLTGVAAVGLPFASPKVIYNMADLAALGIDGKDIVGIVAAHGTVTFTALGATGDYIGIMVGSNYIVGYQKDPSVTTLAQLATLVAQWINNTSYYYGYTATATGAVVTISDTIANGNLTNGTAITFYNQGGLAATSTPLAGGLSSDVNDVAFRQIGEFYDEVGGNQELHIMLLPTVTTMAQMLDDTNLTGARLLLSASPKIRLLGLARKLDITDLPGVDFMHADLAATFAKALTFGDARKAELTPVRILLEGRVANENAATIYSPLTSNCNGYAGAVLGGSLPDGSASVGAALGRAVKYSAEIKIGKTRNGPLAIAKAYIGSKLISTMSNLATLHGLGYISFYTPPTKAGIYFGIDRMGTKLDYRLFTYGRIVDKGLVVAAAMLVDEIEGELFLNADGTIKDLDASHLENTVLQQIDLIMGDQISGRTFKVSRTNNIINTNLLASILRIQPLGYATFITLDIGLTATV